MENNSFKVYIEEKAKSYGRLYLEPLARGYGDTIGNALRRVLLSSIRGAAVTAVRIEGIQHEFSTIKGVREDVIEILMNLKHIPVRVLNETEPGSFKTITLDTDRLPENFFTREKNPGILTAADMPIDNEIEFVGEGVICSLEPKAHFLMEIYVEQGVGYLSAERERSSFMPVDALLTDAIFSPVRRVNYRIESARVGQSIDYERLILEIWTNEAVTPEKAVAEASKIAERCFGHIAATIDTAPEISRKRDNNEENSQISVISGAIENSEYYSHPIHELELSIRSENCLLRGGIQTIGDLLQRSRKDLLNIRNLGNKSLNEIEDKLMTFGYMLRADRADSGILPPQMPEIPDLPDLSHLSKNNLSKKPETPEKDGSDKQSEEEKI